VKAKPSPEGCTLRPKLSPTRCVLKTTNCCKSKDCWIQGLVNPSIGKSKD
jgi:hypothetical protein